MKITKIFNSWGKFISEFNNFYGRSVSHNSHVQFNHLNESWLLHNENIAT